VPGRPSRGIASPSAPPAGRAARRALSELPRLTLRGWALVAASIAVFVLTQVLRRHELAYLATFLLAVPVFSLLWVSLRRFALSVSRRFAPESGSVGQAVSATLFVQNWGSLRTPAAAWSDGAEPPLAPSPPALLDPLPGFTSSRLDTPSVETIRYRVDTSVRGEHAVGPFTVTVTDPFGCAVRRRRIGSTDVLLVTPTVFQLPRIDVRLSTGDGAEQVSRRLVGSGEQDVIARKYLPGDSIRRVHWPATAKHGELMVRQDDQRNDQDAVVLLDAASFAVGAGDETGSAREEVGDPRFEWAVSAAASVSLHLMNEGYGVRAVGHGGAADDDVLVAPFGGSRLLRDLARARPEVLADGGAFREAVDRASLTSPDAPPVFAVVADAPGAADRIRDLAALSSHPVVFVVGPRRGSPARDARTRARTGGAGGATAGATAGELRRAGWNAVDCAADDELPVVWQALGEARGVR
jgi:uncharacterized protein (DUF58 family)